MARKIKHISKERIQSSQKKLEEKLKEDPSGREFLEELAEIAREYKDKPMKKKNQRREGKNESY